MRTALATFVLLAAAGSAAALDHNVRIDLDSDKKSEVTFANLAITQGQGRTTNAATWRKDRPDTFAAALIAAPLGTWSEVAFTATPSVDGKIALSFKGPWKAKKAPAPGEKPELEAVFADVDLVSVEGATVRNGDFEEASKEGTRPVGWWMGKEAEWMKDAADAKSGKAYVHVWHSSPAAQELTVTAGTPITVRAWVRPTAEAAASAKK